MPIPDILTRHQRWRDDLERPIGLVAGPQLIEGWHNGFKADANGTPATTLRAGAWAGFNGHPMERWATEDPEALRSEPDLLITRAPAPLAGPGVAVEALPAKEFLALWKWSTGYTAFDVFAYGEVPAGPPPVEVPQASTRYTLYNRSAGQVRTVGALYRQHPGLTWADHWVLLPGYEPPSATVSLQISKVTTEPVDSLEAFLQRHRNLDALYALVELTWAHA